MHAYLKVFDFLAVFVIYVTGICI